MCYFFAFHFDVVSSEHISKHENLIKHYDNEKQQLMERLMLESEREIQKMKYLKDEEIKDLKAQVIRYYNVVLNPSCFNDPLNLFLCLYYNILKSA